MRSESGFTLIELLSVIAIIGVLAGLSVQSYAIYKSRATYMIAAAAMHTSENALEDGLLRDPDNLPVAVPLTAQVGQGSFQDVRALLPTMSIPSNVRVAVSYAPACAVAACTSDFIQTGHCRGTEWASRTRFGDGSVVMLERQTGGTGNDCS